MRFELRVDWWIATSGRDLTALGEHGPPKDSLHRLRLCAKSFAVTGTPASLGYRMPAEWEPHAATWIAWPHNRQDWPGKFQPIPWAYAEIVRHLSRHETVEPRPKPLQD